MFPINPLHQKCFVFGLQGGGKTYFAREMVKQNNLKVLVVSPHKHDFENEPDNFYLIKDFNPQLIDTYLSLAKQMCLKGILDGIFCDELEMYFGSNILSPVKIDIMANHRHYRMSFIGISRRPQDIPTKLVETGKYIVSFALQGDNVKTKFNGIYKGMGEQILSLNYESFNYVLKEIGKPPIVCQKV